MKDGTKDALMGFLLIALLPLYLIFPLTLAWNIFAEVFGYDLGMGIFTSVHEEAL